MNLFETRKKYKLSQANASEILGVPIRTYIRYEKDNGYGDALKRKMMIEALNEKFEINEDKRYERIFKCLYLV